MSAADWTRYEAMAAQLDGEVFPALPDAPDGRSDGLPGPSAAEAWPEPTPLPAALPSVARFDFELLPHELRGWVADIAERMQCPPDFSAVAVITTVSSLIGARAVVAPKARDDWRVVPNLWGLVVGRPGVMKSPALGEVLRPLSRMETTERAYSTRCRTGFHADAGQHSTVIADIVPC